MNQTGWFGVIYGPMFSQKTSEAILRLRRRKSSPYGNKTCMVRFKIDTRYSSELVVSHDGMEIESISTETLTEIFDFLLEYDMIGIDEAQFFPDAYDVIFKLVVEYNKYVVAAALDTDFKGRPFNHVGDLISIADYVEKRTAVCKACGSENGIYSKRIGNDTELIVIGGHAEYFTACRKCFFSDKPRLSVSQ